MSPILPVYITTGYNLQTNSNLSLTNFFNKLIPTERLGLPGLSCAAGHKPGPT
jgi:hypothetical protein